MEQFIAEWQEYRDDRERELAMPHGWLSITGMRWLEPGENQWDDIVGTWRVDGDWVYVELAGGEKAGPTAEALRVASAPEPGREVNLDIENTFAARLADEQNLNWIADRETFYELIRRGPRYGVRIRDSKSDLLRSFIGVPTFPPTRDWVIAGQFAAYDRPQRHTIDTAHPGLSTTIDAVGEVSFEHRGTRYTLMVVGDGGPDLLVSFHDTTNGETTAPWRFVGIGTPDSQGRVVIDFNRSSNYPSAFTPYGTCPAPIPGNSLPFAIEAGERKPAQILGHQGINIPLLIVQTARGFGYAEIADWWTADGLDLTLVSAWRDPLPAVTAFRGVVILDGDADPGDPDAAPWLAEVCALISDALAADVPMLGIGLGAVLIAQESGATVSRSDDRVDEPILRTAEGVKDQLFSVISDAVHAPFGLRTNGISELAQDMVALAGTESNPVWAFRSGVSAWGLLARLDRKNGAERDLTDLASTAEVVEEWRTFTTRFAQITMRVN